MNKPEEFYNNRITGLLEDYVFGIDRMENAISSLSEFIPSDIHSIADVGCGIGWSSFEISQFFPNAKVDGFDLSPVLIDNGQRLFQSENLNFFQKDITESEFNLNYDCILMIDVYEHIPSGERAKFHRSLKKCLKEKGRLIFACPTKFYQNWLRQNKPSGLQPVDEDVDAETFIKIASDIDGELIYLEYQRIWEPNDYLYAVIEKNTKFNSANALRNNRKFQLEPKEVRLNRVKENLNIDFNQGKKNTPKHEKLNLLKKKLTAIYNRYKKL